MTKVKNDLAKYLESQFLSWQQGLGRRATVSEFADYLDLDRTQLGQYMNGHILPKKEVADRIAKKLGYEIYDLLNYERPDPLVMGIIESMADPAKRKFLRETYDFIQGLDDEGREEFSRYLQSKENAIAKAKKR